MWKAGAFDELLGDTAVYFKHLVAQALPGFVESVVLLWLTMESHGEAWWVMHVAVNMDRSMFADDYSLTRRGMTSGATQRCARFVAIGQRVRGVYVNTLTIEFAGGVHCVVPTENETGEVQAIDTKVK
jgi:hypothetical protein